MKQLLIQLIQYLKEKFKHVFVYFLFTTVFFIVFYLYHLPLETILYATLICFVFGIILFIYDFYRFYCKHKILIDVKNNISATMKNLPEPKTLIENDYQSLIEILYKDKKDLIFKTDKRYSDLLEYYTIWTHQIKTPLSAIDFLLQSKEESLHDDLELQIFEVEKYVDMALQYLRIDSMSSDLRLEEYSIQKIIKRAIKFYSKSFIYKGIGLKLDESDLLVVTDEKWLLFVIKQILSNSLKYTNKGEILIYLEGNVLIIEDTGIGIRKEDIPRIFEKGFTGYSGRIDEKSTGLGLYLCKRILKNLDHKIEITSTIDIGTKVKIDLSREKLEIT